MKNLIYKEFKLAWHPVCYVFPILFSFFILIPNYPAFVGMMLTGITYTILFIGANKGKQTNDLLYTINLPVKRQDIVLARFFSMFVMQMITIVLTIALAPLSQLIRNALNLKNNIGFDLAHIGNTIAFGLLGFIIVDAFYILMYYKNGRSIIVPSLVGMLCFAILLTVFTMILPITVKPYNNFFCSNNWTQFIAVAIAIVIYSVSHIFILKGGIKRLNKLEF